jgi:hypothetical protein
MFYKKHFFAIAILFFTLAASAQDGQVVPGLRGKRLFVEGNFSCLPLLVLGGPTSENGGLVRFKVGDTNPTDFVFPLSWRSSLLLHYVTGRKTSIFGGYEHFQTGLLAKVYTRSIVTNIGTQDGSADESTLFMALKANVAEIGMEWNTGRAMLAPIGAYFRLSLQYYMFQSQILDKTTIYKDYNNKYYIYDNSARPGTRAIGLDNAKAWDIGTGIEFGTRTVIAPNTTFNFGLRMNFPAMWLFDKKPQVTTFGGEFVKNAQTLGLPEEEATQANNVLIFNQAVHSRNVSHSFIMLNLGIGYLIK